MQKSESKRTTQPGSEASREIQDILDSIRRIVQVLREASRRSEADVGLTAAQLFVLQVLSQHPSLSINEVAERTHTHQSSVSVVVQRLVDRGFLTRQRSTEDARRQVVALTPAGRELIGKTADPAQLRLIGAISNLSDPRRQELARSLKEIVAAMALGEAPPPMFFEDQRSAAPSDGDKDA